MNTRQDIQEFVAEETVRWFASGKLDYVPTTILAGYAKLNRVHDAVRDDPRVKVWYAKG